MLVPLSFSEPAFADAGGGPGPIPVTPYSGFNPILSRAPYVTDLTATSAVVTWATNPNVHGAVYYGPSGNCTANQIPVVSGEVKQVRVSPNPTTTYPTRYDYQSSVPVTGLQPGTTYCYEVFGAGTTNVDLLPASQPFQTFTTLDPPSVDSTTPLTFDVLGDFGDTANRGAASDPNANNPTSVNTNQAAIDSLIGASGARFVIGLGDIAYNDGSNSNYGDLEETGTSVGTPNLTGISDIFGPNYWPLTGGVPMFAVDGNHGQNSNTLTTWPESTTASNSGGTYAMQTYSGVDGINTATYPSDWYAFASGNVRFYILDGAWPDSNVGTAAGSACPHTAGATNCKIYQVDADAHFMTSSPEYQWLANDLQAHPGGIKLAFIHFPLRSDNNTQDSDVYLQQDLEPLLAQNGVDMVFGGHAHDYERNTTAGPNTLISYVTGGGGGVISTVSGGTKCSSWDAYAIGWSYSHGTGSKCGSATAPTSDSQVYNYLKVKVSGNSVTVDPTNAAGQIFDSQTYTFAPSAPSQVTATADSPTSVKLSWAPSTETGGTIASYQISRNGNALTSVPGTATSYTDSSVAANTSYTYTVTAVDEAGTTSSPGTSNTVTTPSLATPSIPSQVTATAVSPGTVQLTWGPSTEAGGTIASYQINRNGNALTSVPGTATSYTDSSVAANTSYTYSVSAVDGNGNSSSPGTSNSVTTPLLVDGFESGTLAGWAPVVGSVAAENQVAHSGSYAAGLSSTGGQTFALQNLPGSSPVPSVQGWVYVASQSTSMTLFGLRTQATSNGPAYQVAQVYLDASGRIKVLNNVSKASYLSSTVVPAGAWHRINFTVNETAGTMQVSLDGSAVPFGTSTVLSGQNLGTVPMSDFQLGDDSTNRTYGWYADDLVVSSTAPGS